jgi:ubiquinone/menaquinone biosynthesis C-methylase UbiE
MTTKAEEVKLLFGDPTKYLEPRRFDIRIRTETVQRITTSLTFDRVLDIGCGDGSISLPLLAKCRQLTLLDLSEEMLRTAKSKIPADRMSDVRLINGDFMDADLDAGSFDLILCIGVLAHVDSAEEVVSKVMRLLRPGGSVVLEFTDSFHFWGQHVVAYQRLRGLVKPMPYRLNRFRKRYISTLLSKNKLRIVEAFRYGLPPVGSQKFISQEMAYKLIRRIFGEWGKNRNRWMGNQYIYRLQKAEQ